MFLKFSSLFILCLFAAINCSAQKQTAAARKEVPASQQVARDRLSDLLAKQQSALQGGDAESIRAATTPLLAELLERQALVELAETEKVAAVQTLGESLALEATTSKRLQMATLLLATNNNAEAFDQAHAITTEHPDNSEAWTLKGTALRAQGKYEAAVECFERSLQLRAELKVAYALGSTYLALKEKQKAAQVFENIISASGNAPLWHVAVGDAYREAKDYERAKSEFSLALQLDPHAPHANFFLGLTYLQMNEWSPNASSRKYLTLAAQAAPRDYAPQFYLGAMESSEGTDLTASDKYLEAAAAIDPSRPEVWQYLGLNASREKNDAKAEQMYRKAIDLSGSDLAQNNYQIRRSYYGLGRLLLKNGKRQDGSAFLQKYKQLEDLSVAAGGQQISSMSSSDDLHDAAKVTPLSSETIPVAPAALGSHSAPLESKNLVELKRTREELNHLLGNAYNDLGTAEARQQNYADALVQFQQAERWDSSNGQVLRNLGTAAFRVENFPEASRALTAYMKLESPADKTAPAVQRAGLMLGFSSFNMGKFDEAAKAFGDVQSATMADPRAAYSWAFSLARTGHIQEANGIADQLVKQPLPADQLALVCHLYVDDENYEGSLDCYRKAYAADSALQLAHYEAGQALVHLDRPVEAIAEFQQEEKLSPGNPNVESALAYALLQASRKDEAETLLNRVTAEHPEQAEAQYQLGKLLLEQGKVTDAISHLEASEKANASPDYVHYQLGVAYKKAGRQADAERELKVYREIKDKKREASSAAIPQAQ